MAAKTDNFQSPDYFGVDELLTEEHKLIRETVRNYVKKDISPIIEEYEAIQIAPLNTEAQITFTT